MELVEFLRARYDEDERAALETGASDHPAWHVVVWDSPLSPTLVQAAHISRHGPRRVLRDVEAKRQIIDWHTPPDYRQDRLCDCGEDGWPCMTVRLLALPFADHSDYDQGWRP